MAKQKQVMEEMGKKIKRYQRSAASGESGDAAGGKPGFYALSEGDFFFQFVCAYARLKVNSHFVVLVTMQNQLYQDSMYRSHAEGFCNLGHLFCLRV